MKAHELARRLLEQPDEQVMYYDGDDLLFVGDVVFRYEPSIELPSRVVTEAGIRTKAFKLPSSNFIQLLP